MQLIELDGYPLHSLIERVPSNVHRGVSGLAAPEDRIESGAVAGDHGLFITSTLSGGRTISIPGRLRGGETDFPVLRQAFIAATTNKRDANGRVAPRTLRLYDLDGRDYQIGVVRRSLEFDHELPTTAEFLLQLVAPDPWIYAQEETSLTLTLPTGGGYTVPVTYPKVYGNATGGTGTITNEGTAITKPVVEFHGPLTNPALTNETTGKRIGLTLTLGVGEVVILDMQRRTAIQGTSTNRMGFLSSGYSWWGLPTGPNDLRLSADTYEAGYAVVRARSAWQGL